jgi:hypothetical protein
MFRKLQNLIPGKAGVATTFILSTLYQAMKCLKVPLQHSYDLINHSVRKWTTIFSGMTVVWRHCICASWHSCFIYFVLKKLHSLVGNIFVVDFSLYVT